MADNIFTIELSKADYEKLMSKLDGLTEFDKQASISDAMRRGMCFIADAGRRNLASRILHPQKSTGKLMKSIGVTTKKASKRKSAKGYAAFQRPGGNAAHLVDRGTNKRWTKKGFYRGSVQKNNANQGSNFWTDAVQQNGDKALDTLMNTIDQSITKILSR